MDTGQRVEIQHLTAVDHNIRVRRSGGVIRTLAIAIAIAKQPARSSAPATPRGGYDRDVL